MNNYVCYHLHTEDSLLDSCTNYKDYVDYANSLGQKAICFTEHGNIFNWFKKKQYVEKCGMKYMHGIECYLTEKLRDPNDPDSKNIRDNYHTILIAKDREGMIEINNLFWLSSRSDHFYYKRRLTFDEFFAISDHVIKISACVQSPLNKFRKHVDECGRSYNDTLVLKKLLMHYDYYEIQAHNMPEQIEYNQYLYKMSKKFHKPLIAATDTHSLNSYKAECRTVLQYGKTDGDWGDSENECDLTYQTYDSLVEMFRIQNALPEEVYLAAIEETNRMADRVEYIPIDTTNKYPILYGDNDEEMLWKVIKQNYKYKLDNHIISDDPKYIENIKEEMRVFKKIDMVGFMLFMSEIMTWARSNHIATGFARGSVAGSTVAYIANITDVDPVKWGTVFSRFANENRVEAGDIDTDWYEDDRQKVYDYIIDRFGTNKTAYILAMGTLADKSVIDVIGKSYRVKAQKEGVETPYTIDFIKQIKEEYDRDRDGTTLKYPDIFYYYDGLVNCIVSQSQHPAGLIVSSVNLPDVCGVFYGADGQLIVPLDMDECHDMGQIKYDILGLKSVGVIDKTYKMLNEHFPRADQIDWNDQKVYEDIAKDHTAIFQFESAYSGDCLKKFKPTSVGELSLVNACIRPSGETYRDQLLNRIPHKNPSDILDKMLEGNLGYLVYQEDTLAFLQNICGFSGSAADSVRRAIGKKNEDEINKALPKILDGYCSKSSHPREQAEEEAKQFLEIISSSASYQFGYNHSVSYSMLSYVMGYLRYYHPVEFCTAFLNCAKNDADVLNGTALARSHNVNIIAPIFRYSNNEYTCDSEKRIIYKGLPSIKYISTDATNDLYELRNNKYESFIDLLSDIKQTRCDARMLDILIRIDFFREFGTINELLKITELYDSISNRKQIKLSDLSTLGIPEWIADKHGKHTTKIMKDFDSKELLKDVVANTEMPKTTLYDKISYELDCLGYIQTTVPKAPEDYAYITDISGYSDNILQLYYLHDGHQKTIKYRKKGNPSPQVGNIIKVIDIIDDWKWKKLGDGSDEWVRTDDKEEKLAKFGIIR